MSFRTMEGCTCVWGKPTDPLSLGVRCGVRGSGFKSDIISKHKDAFSVDMNCNSNGTRGDIQ